MLDSDLIQPNYKADSTSTAQSNLAQELEHKYHIQVYNRFPITITRGQGAKVWDSEGNEYIDLLAGIAVNNVGHAHPRVVKAVQNAAISPLHFSNFYYSEPQSLLAKKLSELTGLDRVFFCSSGAEAMEAVLNWQESGGTCKGKKALYSH